MSVSLDVTLCTLTLGYASYVYLYAFFEISNCDCLSDFVSFAFFDSEFNQMLFSFNTGLIKMTFHRLVDSVRLCLTVSHLNGVISVSLNSLNLCNNFRTRFDYSYRNNCSFRVEDLCHSDLLSN